MRNLLGKFHVTGVFWFRIHCWGLSILPDWGVWVINNVFSAFFFVLLLKIRTAISNNLSVVLGPTGWWRRQQRIWRTMLTFSWCLSERYDSMITDRSFHFEADGLETWEEVTSRDRGLIMVTAHIGHWKSALAFPSKTARGESTSFARKRWIRMHRSSSVRWSKRLRTGLPRDFRG